MTGWTIAAFVWLVGFARTACHLDRPRGMRFTAALLWPVVLLPCLLHLPKTLRGWRTR